MARKKLTADESFAVQKMADYELTTTLAPAQIVAGCRAMHDMQGSEDADSLIHHPAAKSWEPKTEPRWSQWIETVVYVAEAIGRQALAEEARK